MKPVATYTEAKFLNLAFSNRYKADIEAIYSRLLPYITTNDLVAIFSDLATMPGDLFNDIAFAMIQTEIKNREIK